jgi:hypothetical protein
MAIDRTSDSMSRCDPTLYSNIYDVRKRSDIKHPPIHATQPVRKDTIELSRDKLKEEALSRLRHTSKYVIAQSSFMRIGKYLFLSIAFPPYLLLYGLPKWILVEALPAVFSMCVWIWKRVQQKMQKRVEASGLKVVHLSQFMRNLIIQVLVEPIVRLGLVFRKNIQRMREQTLQFFRQINKKTKFALSMPHRKVIEAFKNLQKKLSQVREKFETLSTKLQESVQWVKQSPQLFLGWAQGQLQRINEQTTSWRLKWSEKFQTSHQLAQRTTNWIASQIKHGLEGFKRDFKPILAIFRQHVLSHWRTLKETFKSRWKQTKDFFHQKHQKALTFLQKKQEKIKQLSGQYLVDRLLSHLWINKLPLRLQQRLKMWLSHPLFRKMSHIAVESYSFLARILLGTATQILILVSKGTEFIFKVGSISRAYLARITHQLLQVVNIGHRMLLKTAFYALYYFLLVTMICAILAMWGIRYLADLMGSLSSNFSRTLGINLRR